jgi:site-specific DNA-methyltransferase (adenine-specific)
MTLLKGNCLETLKTLEDNSIDSIVTDPPYELGFMGKSWDASGIAYNVELWREALRVLKPGGHLLAFSGSRTYHRMAVAIEDAGFEIRDQIMWIYGSGFPKSLDVSKAIDKSAGAKRNRVPFDGGIASGQSNYGGGNSVRVNDGTKQEDTPATSEAQQWQGWGTALKPAHEPIVVARKPLTGTVASNVLEWGTGALNIDGSRVGTETIVSRGGRSGAALGMYGVHEPLNTEHTGRWPANVIHDGSEEVLEGFPKQAGAGGKASGPTLTGGSTSNSRGKFNGVDDSPPFYGDSGSAARFFYCAKASKAERNAGLENQNFHPTVKPLALMRYLVKLVTPPNGLVLDPFLGSGSTAVAAILEGFNWVGCEMTEDYWPIIEARVAWAQKEQEGKLL